MKEPPYSSGLTQTAGLVFGQIPTVTGSLETHYAHERQRAQACTATKGKKENLGIQTGWRCGPCASETCRRRTIQIASRLATIPTSALTQ